MKARIGRWLQAALARVDIPGGGFMDTSELTWRDKLAIVDVTARIAVAMLLVMVAFCEVLTIAVKG